MKKIILSGLENGEYSRDFSLTVKASDLDLKLDSAEIVSPLVVTGEISKQSDGYLISGTITYEKEYQCDYCLSRVHKKTEDIFSETFLLDATAEAECVQDGIIDISALIHDTVVAAQPISNLCREDCQGLCSKCGANLNEQHCECDRTSIDIRWSALQDWSKKKK